MCEYDDYNHELNFYFEKEIHISEKFSDFETNNENKLEIRKIIDLNKEQLKVVGLKMNYI